MSIFFIFSNAMKPSANHFALIKSRNRSYGTIAVDYSNGIDFNTGNKEKKMYCVFEYLFNKAKIMQIQETN